MLYFPSEFNTIIKGKLFIVVKEYHPADYFVSKFRHPDYRLWNLNAGNVSQPWVSVTADLVST